MGDIPKTTRHEWPTTHWSVVARAGSPSGVEQRAALVSLLEGYLPVLRWHLVARGLARRDTVDDLLQEFLLSKVLEEEILAKADRARGKFRSFLVSTLDRFVLNCLREEKAVKRSVDRCGGFEGNPEPADHRLVSPDLFEKAWGRQVLGQAVRRMRMECRAAGRNDIWGVFKGRILLPSLQGVPNTPYPELVRRFNLKTPAKASNILITANRMFARVLRGVIAVYEEDEADIESEIQDLWRALGSHRAGFTKISGSRH